MSNIIVTGGAGFIASHLVDRLISQDHKVTIIDNLSTGNISNINNDAIFYESDIRDVKSLDEIFSKERPDFVFHLAAQINLRDSFKDPVNDVNNNIIGTLNIIEVSKKYNIKNLVFTSTGGAIYDPLSSNPPWVEFNQVKPCSPYGISKLAAENYISTSGLNYNIFRLANVYGPRQNSKGEAGVISIFIDKIRKNENLVIFGDGEQSRDFIYIDNVIDYLILPFTKSSIKNTIINVGTGKETTVNRIAEIILEKMNSNLNIDYQLPIPGELRRSSLYSYMLSHKGISNVTNFTSIEDGIKKTIGML